MVFGSLGGGLSGLRVRGTVDSSIYFFWPFGADRVVVGAASNLYQNYRRKWPSGKTCYTGTVGRFNFLPDRKGTAAHNGCSIRNWCGAAPTNIFSPLDNWAQTFGNDCRFEGGCR
jgi:hypothetical protein